MNYNQMEQRRRGSAAILGVLLAGAGVLFLLRQFGIIHFSFQIWPLFLIAGGLMSGIKNGFRRPGAYIMIAIGAAYLVPEFTVFGQSSSNLVWPLALIGFGLFIAFRPKKNCVPFSVKDPGFAKKWGSDPDTENVSTAGFVNIEAIFGGRKEIITSKQFRGANATAICGGAEINLMQADSEVQPMIIDVRAIFGGIEVIVPSHWEVVNEVDVLFGGIEDKRVLRTSSESAAVKTLLLRGTVTFAGMEIKSY